MHFRKLFQLWTATLVVGCSAALGGCSMFSKPLKPGAFPWAVELGTSNIDETAKVPSEAGALGHFLKAELATNNGDHDVAMKEYEAAVAADPSSALLRQRLTMLYVRANRLQEAKQQIEAAVELDPEDVQSRVLLAGILSALGQEDAAVAEYEHVLQLDPKNQEAHLFLGALYGKRNQFP